LLGFDILSPSLKPDIVSTMALSNSLHWESWSDVEWPVDMEAKLLVESFRLLFRGLINIDNLPFLLDRVVSTSNIDSVTFSWGTGVNNSTSSLGNELLIFVWPFSPPSCVLGIDVDWVGSD
jgi:hypothetical protein